MYIHYLKTAQRLTDVLYILKTIILDYVALCATDHLSSAFDTEFELDLLATIGSAEQTKIETSNLGAFDGFDLKTKSSETIAAHIDYVHVLYKEHLMRRGRLRIYRYIC